MCAMCRSGMSAEMRRAPMCAMRRGEAKCLPTSTQPDVSQQSHCVGLGSLDAYRGQLEHEGPSRALFGTGAPASSAPSQGMSARRAANPTLSPASEIPSASVAASRWTLRWPGFPGPAFAQSSGAASCTGPMDADLEDRSTSASHCSALCSAPCETTRACRRWLQPGHERVLSARGHTPWSAHKSEPGPCGPASASTHEHWTLQSAPGAERQPACSLRRAAVPVAADAPFA